MKKYFTEEDIHTANKHMKRCLNIIREVQSNTMMKYLYIPIRTAKMKNRMPNHGEDAEKLNLSHTDSKNIKWYRNSGK